MTDSTQLEKDLQAYNTLLTLWQAENPIKTIKLQFLLVTNAVLLGFYHLSSAATLDRLFEDSLFALGGFVFNVIWTLSIGRTSLFQKAWKNKLDDIAQHHPNDARFQILDLRQAEPQAPFWLRLIGSISSKYYLLGAPIAFSITWICLSLLPK